MYNTIWHILRCMALLGIDRDQLRRLPPGVVDPQGRRCARTAVLSKRNRSHGSGHSGFKHFLF